MLATRVRIGRNIRRAALLAVAAMSLAGCADLARVTSLKPTPVDPNSPVAGQVRAASRASTRTPRFSDVPPLPKDVRPAKGFATAVTSSNQAGAQLDAYVAANPPGATQSPAETEAFADSQRARIPADQKGIAPPDPAGAEELAARLRAYAAPPPPPK